MRIAICDDDIAACSQAAALIEQGCSDRMLQAPVLEQFYSGAELLQAAARTPFDLYLLDILMPEMNGIALAAALRRGDERAKVVFLTSSPEYGLDAFRVRAADYLLKPLEVAALDRVLDDLILKMAEAKAHCLTVPARDGDVLLPYHQVSYVENGNHVLTYHLVDGTQLATRTLREPFVESIRQLLCSPLFFQCHRSFAVNARRVRCFSEKKRELTLEEGAVIPVSRTRIAEVRGRLLDSLAAGGHEEEPWTR